MRKQRRRRQTPGNVTPRKPHWLAMGALITSAAVTGTATPAYATTARRPITVTLADDLLARRFDLDELLVVVRAGWPVTFDGPAVPHDWVRGDRAFAQSPASARTADPEVRQFEIPPGPLTAALSAFEAATGLKVVVDADMIRDLTSPGVSGLLTAEQALVELLTGTSLSYRITASGTVMVDFRLAPETVEVTGRAPELASPKYTQPLREIPQTITVIPAVVIQQQGATTLRDVLRNVSGITFQAGEGGVPAGDQLTIRGFSARTDIFIDGVRDFGGYSRDSFNIDQVEVAKGPSSAVAGRGSTGGSINQVSKVPSLRKAYRAEVGAGNADYRRSTMDINQPLTALGEGASVRLNAMWTDSGVPGRAPVNNERWGIAPSIAFGLTGTTRFTAHHLHLAQDNLPEYGLPWVPANTNPELEAYQNGQPPVDQSNFYGLTTRDYEKTVTDVATAQVDHMFAQPITLRNLTRYGQTKRDSVITAPRFIAVNTSTDINRQLQSRDMKDTIVANQTNFTARPRTGALQHAIAAGLEFSRETSVNFLRAGPTAPLADLYHPDPNAPYHGPIVRTGAVNDGSANSAAVYAFDTVNLTEQWEVTGGLRWDRFAVDYDQTLVGGAVTAFDRTDQNVSWRAGVIFKPRPTASIYAGGATSMNPSAEGLALTAATVNLEPEKTLNLEVGTKWDVMNERLSLSMAGFRTEKSNARTPGLNAGDPATVLEGKQIVNGIELGASGKITEQWTALANYAYMHSDIAASNTAAEIDNALALTPANTLNLWTTYQPIRDLVVGGGVQYMDAVYRNATNLSAVPSYWLVSALASYAVNEHLTLRLNGQNLTNEKYIDRVGGGHYIPGPRRQAMLTADFSF